MIEPDLINQINSICKNRSKEVCGYILDGKAIESENKAKHPSKEFEMDFPDDYDMIFHSHPGGPFYPTKIDMEQQIATDVPWLIYAENNRTSEVFGWGFANPPDLFRRPFRHAITDCYELLRDFFFKQHGIEFKAVPRDWEWWEDSNLYLDGVEDAGFVPVDLSKIEPGDVIFANIRTSTPNHAAVYLGNDLIFHHVTGQLGYEPSRCPLMEPAGRWQKFFYGAYRYETHPIDRTVGQGLF